MSLTTKLINDLRAYAKDRKGELAKLINDAADTIELLSDKLHASQMERSSQYYHGGWIPCSERLPEADGRYLVTRGLKVCNSIWNRVYIINYSDLMGLKSEKIWWEGNVGKPDFQKIDDVTAWMPIPELYDEGA